jgi:hypothetical protein
MQSNSYDDVCKIHCTDNDRVVDGEILNFKPEAYLDVSLNRSLKVQLRYNKKQELYVGSMAGLEFTTKGPKKR